MKKESASARASAGKAGLRTVATIVAVVMAVAFAYAIIRYNVIKGVPWQELPLFISNKAVALAAVFFIALSYDFGPLARFWPKVFVPELSTRKFFGLLGFGLAAVHASVSLLLFSPAYYPKFFTQAGKLNLTGELSMLFGVLAFAIFSIIAITSFPAVEKSLSNKQWQMLQRIGYLAFFMVMLHVLAMGFEGWLKPAGWPGGLLPISLVAFIAIALTLLIRAAVIIFPGNRNMPKK
ncbi:ferric reductase-like transmembrane domain-containing protein [Candidatus Woesearchaeota archaeon]|nr:ferric reductase-like transmembrane domain-containing protein [Candidatus Woesearchaeota archaeon]